MVLEARKNGIRLSGTAFSESASAASSSGHPQARKDTGERAVATNPLRIERHQRPRLPHGIVDPLRLLRQFMSDDVASYFTSSEAAVSDA
jgi:hypothetical protein